MRIVDLDSKKPIQSVKCRPVEEKDLSAEMYLRTQFTRKEAEHRVDFKEVDSDTFRINFWSYRKSTGSSHFKESYLSRSYYVKCFLKENKWTHKVY